EGSRMVITGDRSQVDLPRGVNSGLRDAEDLLKGIKDISFNYFTAKDVVRHPLVAKIIEAYDKAELRWAWHVSGPGALPQHPQGISGPKKICRSI
ncbi:MAG: PhoH family protein, partial [Maritimibacter sp.]